MNEGVISLFLLIIMLFIFIGGWLQQELHHMGWKASYILFTLLMIWFIAPIHFPYIERPISVLVVLLPLLAMQTMRKVTAIDKIVVLVTSIFIAILYNLMILVITIDPILLVIEERLLLGGFFGALIGFFYISLKEKWIISTLGIWLGVLLFYVRQFPLLENVSMMSYYDLDLLFIVYFVATLIHLFTITITQWLLKKWKRTHPFS